MCDQLRADYLTCYGHPTLQTPNIDALAKRGVRFESAYVQSPVCGPSRMCCYTGRYAYSHGAVYNRVPLNVGQPTMGDYLRGAGMQTVLIGKTHMAPDTENITRLGLPDAATATQRVRQAGFDVYERDDGLHPDELVAPDYAYNAYLREQGYTSDNPWHDNANSAIDENGEILSGWFMRNAHIPANIKAEHSETPYITSRAMDFIEQAGDDRWCVHLSYIKPHWPYIVPAPYHDIYTTDDMLPPIRDETELQNMNPVYDAFTRRKVSQTFARDEVRERVIPTYMGLIHQIDDEIGRLMRFMDEKGLLENTMIVFTSDHGDYLGDHWLGEKELFHEQSIRIPLIIVDPSPEADSTRGTVENHLVELIDLAPTFLEFADGEPQPHRLEGRSLLPLVRGEPITNWRDAVFCEMDYTGSEVSELLDLPVQDYRMTMIRTRRWKYILHEAFPPQLFDLENDPNEFVDLGQHADYTAIRAELHERLFTWFRNRKTRITATDEWLYSQGDDNIRANKQGIKIGFW